MFLTNDIALFLIIPFTLQLNACISVDIRPLLIFETFAVNVGSQLTPIGNPQNIYLWQKTGVSFFHFISAMIPPFPIPAFIFCCRVDLRCKAVGTNINHTTTGAQLFHGCNRRLFVDWLFNADALGFGRYMMVAFALGFLILIGAYCSGPTGR